MQLVMSGRLRIGQVDWLVLGMWYADAVVKVVVVVILLEYLRTKLACSRIIIRSEVVVDVCLI